MSDTWSIYIQTSKEEDTWRRVAQVHSADKDKALRITREHQGVARAVPGEAPEYITGAYTPTGAQMAFDFRPAT